MGASLREKVVQTATEMRFCVILSLACYICRLVCMWEQGRGREEEAERERIGGRMRKGVV